MKIDLLQLLSAQKPDPALKGKPQLATGLTLRPQAAGKAVPMLDFEATLRTHIVAPEKNLVPRAKADVIALPVTEKVSKQHEPANFEQLFHQTENEHLFHQSEKGRPLNPSAKGHLFHQSEKDVPLNQPAKGLSFPQSEKALSLNQPAKGPLLPQSEKALSLNQPAKGPLLPQSEKSLSLNQPAKGHLFHQSEDGLVLDQSEKIPAEVKLIARNNQGTEKKILWAQQEPEAAPKNKLQPELKMFVGLPQANTESKLKTFEIEKLPSEAVPAKLAPRPKLKAVSVGEKPIEAPPESAVKKPLQAAAKTEMASPGVSLISDQKSANKMAHFAEAAPTLHTLVVPQNRRPVADDSADETPRVFHLPGQESLALAPTLVSPFRLMPVIDTNTSFPKSAHEKVSPLAVQIQKSATLDQLAARAKSQLEPVARVSSEPDEKKTGRVGPLKKEVVKEERKTDEIPALKTEAAPTPVASEPLKTEAPPAIRDAAPLAPLAPLMMEDPSLRVVLLPTIARLSLDTGEAGQLNVQLKMHDGVTDVRASGPAAQLLESRQGEIRVALAKEGLAMGHFDLTQSGSQQRHAERPEFETSPRPTAPRATHVPETATEDGRVHVKA